MEPEHEDFDQLLDKLAKSARSPRGRFSAKNNWELLEKQISFPRRKPNLPQVILRVAASLLLFLASWYAYDLLRPVSMQAVSTQGEIITVVLPDQSKVILNRYSTLHYPVRFKGKKREVRLEGEAYFDVEKDTAHPFIVKAESVDVQVLGTQFNVEAYPKDATVRTTLLEGSVAISAPGEKIVLSPNESAVYHRKDKKLQHETSPESADEIAWCRGDFFFNQLPLQEIARQLSNAFNIKIKITDPALKNYRIRAHFSQGENLEQILELLQDVGNFSYTRGNDTILIKTKQYNTNTK